MLVDKDSLQSQIDHLHEKFVFAHGVIDAHLKRIEELESQIRIIESREEINANGINFNINKINDSIKREREWLEKVFKDQNRRLQKLESAADEDKQDPIRIEKWDDHTLREKIKHLHFHIGELKGQLMLKDEKIASFTMNIEELEKKCKRWMELFYEVRPERDNKWRGQADKHCVYFDSTNSKSNGSNCK